MRPKLIITCAGGEMTIASYCLKTDSWHDFISFREEALEAFQKDDLRKSNRYLRAAVVFLFAHFEAVINDIGYTNGLFTNGLRGLCKRMDAIEQHLADTVTVPDMNIVIGKNLRDIVAHPGIQKLFNGDARGDDAVFEMLTLTELDNLERDMSSWLDTICPLLDVQRFADTEKLVNDFVVGIQEEHGGTSDPIRSI